MVVDDESDNLDLLYRTFRRDFEVFKAESAFRALEILEHEQEMGIIISDQRMPKMNGTEFLSRAANRFPDTIRILLTGYTDVEDLVEAINTGKVFKYITKPWNPEELKSTVNQAAETYRVLKQRTNELQRSLRRESLFNAVTTAIRESLDYRSMLQTIVETLGRTFSADSCILRPVDAVEWGDQHSDRHSHRLSAEVFVYPPGERSLPEIVLCGFEEMLTRRRMQVLAGGFESEHQIFMPLIYQQELLAVMALARSSTQELWSDGDINLLEQVVEQAALAISQAKLYCRIQEQTEQMRAELAVARQIQSNLLRQKLPELENVKIQACCYPAREVGGDFFEVYVHPQGDLWVAVGDVSGKGVPAALFMASAISVLRREISVERPPEPNIIMQNLNSSLLEDLVSNNCFITMVLARYSPATRQLVYANAGHIYPLVWTRSQSSIHSSQETEPTYLKVRGVPLGILSDWKAAAGNIFLQSSDTLLLTSDGITEATVCLHKAGCDRTSNTMLQQEGLWQLLKQERGILDLHGLLSKIQSFTPCQEDDQTILSLEVL